MGQACSGYCANPVAYEERNVEKPLVRADSQSQSQQYGQQQYQQQYGRQSYPPNSIPMHQNQTSGTFSQSSFNGIPPIPQSNSQYSQQQIAQMQQQQQQQQQQNQQNYPMIQTQTSNSYLPYSGRPQQQNQPSNGGAQPFGPAPTYGNPYQQQNMPQQYQPQQTQQPHFTSAGSGSSNNSRGSGGFGNVPFANRVDHEDTDSANEDDSGSDDDENEDDDKLEKISMANAQKVNGPDGLKSTHSFASDSEEEAGDIVPEIKEKDKGKKKKDKKKKGKKNKKNKDKNKNNSNNLESSPGSEVEVTSGAATPSNVDDSDDDEPVPQYMSMQSVQQASDLLFALKGAEIQSQVVKTYGIPPQQMYNGAAGRYQPPPVSAVGAVGAVGGPRSAMGAYQQGGYGQGGVNPQGGSTGMTPQMMQMMQQQQQQMMQQQRSSGPIVQPQPQQQQQPIMQPNMTHQGSSQDLGPADGQ